MRDRTPRIRCVWFPHSFNAESASAGLAGPGPQEVRAAGKSVSLYSFFGYCLPVIAAILAVRVLVQVFRPDAG